MRADAATAISPKRWFADACRLRLHTHAADSVNPVIVDGLLRCSATYATDSLVFVGNNDGVAYRQ